jgi:hypothetical protein
MYEIMETQAERKARIEQLISILHSFSECDIWILFGSNEQKPRLTLQFFSGDQTPREKNQSISMMKVLNKKGQYFIKTTKDKKELHPISVKAAEEIMIPLLAYLKNEKQKKATFDFMLKLAKKEIKEPLDRLRVKRAEKRDAIKKTDYVMAAKKRDEELPIIAEIASIAEPLIGKKRNVTKYLFSTALDMIVGSSLNL